MPEPSGVQWVRRFPGTRSLDDLKEPFRASCKAFVSALADAGIGTDINATFRPPERAYLMHWAWKIDRLGFDPARVPALAGVDIDWTHGGNAAKARAGAKAMVNGYGLVFIAALASHHTRGFAVDMELKWRGSKTIRDAAGAAKAIAGTPRDTMNRQVWRVAESYHVIKHPTDRPHWSIDGR